MELSIKNSSEKEEDWNLRFFFGFWGALKKYWNFGRSIIELDLRNFGDLKCLNLCKPSLVYGEETTSLSALLSEIWLKPNKETPKKFNSSEVLSQKSRLYIDVNKKILEFRLCF